MKQGITLAASLALIFLFSLAARAEQRYSVSGLLLEVDLKHKNMVVSCGEIKGFMDAMVMPFAVNHVDELQRLSRGNLIDFTLVVSDERSYAENIRIHKYDSTEREPSKARRLQGFSEDLRGIVPQVAVGQQVPDFNLIDQKKRTVHLSQFAGKIVVLNFVYTRCVLPEYCFRSSNNLGILQRRFLSKLGRDLVLLSVTFDPVHDSPETLEKYAQTWKADPENWRFLTGAAPDVQKVCELFGVNFVSDEGLFVHSVHTAVIGRDGRLVTNIEGNDFTGPQLADFVQVLLTPTSNRANLPQLPHRRTSHSQ
jgi:protein SCO1